MKSRHCRVLHSTSSVWPKTLHVLSKHYPLCWLVKGFSENYLAETNSHYTSTWNCWRKKQSLMKQLSKASRFKGVYLQYFNKHKCLIHTFLTGARSRHGTVSHQNSKQAINMFNFSHRVGCSRQKPTFLHSYNLQTACTYFCTSAVLSLLH